MKLCTKLVRKWKYVELEPATVRKSGRWGKHYYFEHCNRPAVGSREATNWCVGHSEPPKEKA